MRRRPVTALVLPLVEAATWRRRRCSRARSGSGGERRTGTLAHWMMIGVDLSGTRALDAGLQVASGRKRAPGMAPCSNSSASRTSSTMVPGRRRSSSASAVSTWRISALVAASSSRKLGMDQKAYRSGRDFPQRRRSTEELADRAPEHDVGDVVEVGRLAVDDDHGGAGPLGDRDHAGGRVDRQGRADGESRSQARRRPRPARGRRGAGLARTGSCRS